MLDFIKQLDTDFFLFLNQIHHPIADIFMLWATGDKAWLPLYALIIILLVWKYRLKVIVVLVFIALTITAADQFASGFMKPTCKRLRPCHEHTLIGKVHLVTPNCGGKYGFVSSHAANTFALALFLSLLAKKEFLGVAIQRKKSYFLLVSALFSWAFVVSYSRIYVGVHYPLDIFFGALAGCFFAYLFVQIAKSMKLKPF
jgi:undecaprenyl-diphosphatase